MKAKWIIEHFTGDNGYEGLIEECKAQNRDCQVLNIKNHFTFDPGVYRENECVVFQGSIQMADRIKSFIPTCSPVVWLTKNNYRCQSYYPCLSEHLFNDNVVWTTVAQMKARKFFYYGLFAKQAMIFVRPDDGDKSFKGQLLDLQDFDRFWDNKVACAAKPEDLVVVSSPKNIRGEFRYVCSKFGEIIASSTYFYQGQITRIPSVPEGATQKCQDVLKTGWFPDTVFVADICEDNDGNYWLLELNSFSSAGTYACSPKNLIARISEIAENEWQEKKLCTQN